MNSCSPHDLKDYFFGQLNAAERGAVDSHIADCAACREELSALDVTRAALLAIPDEEPPRRVAFVSDKVFEPNWWQRLWASGPRLGFVSAAMLAGAILAHGFLAAPVRVPAPVAQVQPAPVVDKAAIEAVRAELSKQFDVAVKQAVAASEDERAAKLLDLVNSRIKHSEKDILLIQDYLLNEHKKNVLQQRVALYGDPR